jgi:hypothetical protein
MRPRWSIFDWVEPLSTSLSQMRVEVGTRFTVWWWPKKVQLTLSYGKKKKGDEVEDGDDDDDEDVVRTSASQDRVTAALSTEELFLCTQYIALSKYQSGKTWMGGGCYGQWTQHSTGGQLGLTPLSYASSWFPRLPIRLDLFTNILWLGKTI